jgi:hypothetical protein
MTPVAQFTDRIIHTHPFSLRSAAGPVVSVRRPDEAFVEAHYSQHEVGPEQDQRVRAHWERVKAALRALKRRRESEEQGAG